MTTALSLDCDCIAETEAKPIMLATNTALLTNVIGPRRAFVATVKRDPNRKISAKYLIATFCPFCGRKYEDAA